MSDTRPLVLMLVGSFTTPDMAALSELYAQGCERALSEHYRFATLHRSPAGAWRVGESVDTVMNRPAMTLPGAMAALRGEPIVAVLPQMFCVPGMTEARALPTLMDLPMIGNSAAVMGIGADKALTRAVMRDAGLNVPTGTVVREGEPRPALPPFPVVVKPVASDNSEGLSLVRGDAQLEIALRRAHSHGDALVETFIPPGRELRCGVIAWNGQLRALRPEEYPVDAKRAPIRRKADKLAKGPSGAMRLVAKTGDAAWIVERDDPVIAPLQDAALRAFRALGCRHYGLFDFRVDADGVPWFLEAGLYCSFSPDSVITAMAAADAISLPELLNSFLPEHARRTFRRIHVA